MSFVLNVLPGGVSSDVSWKCAGACYRKDASNIMYVVHIHMFQLLGTSLLRINVDVLCSVLDCINRCKNNIVSKTRCCMFASL